MRKSVYALAVMVALCAPDCAFAAVKAPPAPKQTEPPARRRTATEAMAEALVAKLPQDKLYAAAGFFAPVVKKYQPVLDAFQREYAVSSDRMAVIAKYAPKVDAALADAKAMKVPPRFEKEKADYIRLAEVFATSLRAIVRLNAGIRRL